MSALSIAVVTGSGNPAVEQLYAHASAERTAGAGKTASVPASAQGKSAAAADVAKTDQVQVSKAAEAKLLRSQGLSVVQIEATLGLPETVVTNYLGITDGTQTLIAAATAAVEAQQISVIAA